MSNPTAEEDVVLHVWVPSRVRTAVKMESVEAKENMGETVTRLVDLALKDRRRLRTTRPKGNGA